MKKLLLSALTVLGLAAQTVAAPFTEGQAYKLKHNSSDLYFNMEIDGLGDGQGYHCASLQSEENASVVFFVQNPDDSNQWQIRVNSADGYNLSANSTWSSIINSTDGYYWTVTEYDEGIVTFERTTYASGGQDNFLGPNHATSYNAGDCLWSNQDGANTDKLNAAKFQVIEYNAPRYPVTLTINYGEGKSITVDYGYVEEGTTYTKPAFDSSVLTVTGWNDGDPINSDVNLQGTLAEGVKPFKLNSLRYSGRWATTDANGLLIPEGTFDAAELFFEVPVEGSTNFTIYSLNQLKWLGAINGNVAKIPFADVAGEYQLIKHTSGAEAIGNAGAASTDIAFLNYRNPGIGSWSAGNDAGSHWFMVYDNTNYAANLEAMGVQIGGQWGNIDGSTYATKIAEAEAKYAAVADVADDVVPGFGDQKAALRDAIDAAKAARAGVSGVDIAALLETLTAANEAVNANIVIYSKGLNLINNGNAFAALGIASEEGLAAWQTVVDTAEAMDPSAITETDIENLVTAYGELVATSANTPGGAYVTLAPHMVAGDRLCAHYNRGVYAGYYGEDVHSNMFTWQIVAAEGGFKLYNVYAAKYLKLAPDNTINTEATLVDAANGSNFVFDVFNAETAQYGIKCIDVTEYTYLNTNINNHGIHRWNADANSSWYLALSTADVVVEAAAGAADDIADALANCELGAEYEDYIGEGIGKYTLPEGYADALAAAKAITTDSSNEEKHSAADALRATYANGVTINAPEAGKFYRFQNKTSNLYMTAKVNANNDLELVENGADALETIFYFDGTRLVAWQDGLVLGNYNKDESEVSWKTVLKGAANEGEITFPGSNVLGSYYIQTQLNRRLYGANKTGRGAAIDCGDTNGTGNDYSWTITEVTELPIAYNEGFVWSTLYSPVQLELIEGVQAYTGTLETDEDSNMKLIVNKLTGSIPAETGVLVGVVKSEIVNNGYVYLPIEETTVTDVTSSLTGSFYTVAQETSSEETLALAEEGEGTVYNFVFQEGTDTNADGEEYNFGKFYLDQVSNLTGFSAHIQASSIDEDETITIADSEGNNPTGIEEIAVESEKVQGIYDLQGRRLSAPVKGINIINGKKVLVK